MRTITTKTYAKIEAMAATYNCTVARDMQTDYTDAQYPDAIYLYDSNGNSFVYCFLCPITGKAVVQYTDRIIGGRQEAWGTPATLINGLEGAIIKALPKQEVTLIEAVEDVVCDMNLGVIQSSVSTKVFIVDMDNDPMGKVEQTDHSYKITWVPTSFVKKEADASTLTNMQLKLKQLAKGV